MFTITRAIEAWQDGSPWASREIHFSRLGKNDLAALAEYLKIIRNNRDFLSFKAIAIKRSRTRRRIEEVVIGLHEQMLLQGVAHELESGRIDLPRAMDVSLDEEQSLDAFALAALKRRLAAQLETSYYGALVLGEVQTTPSRKSAVIQLADMPAGAAQRRLNHSGERSYKDDMADLIIEELGLAVTEERTDDSESDSSVIFLL